MRELQKLIVDDMLRMLYYVTIKIYANEQPTAGKGTAETCTKIKTAENMLQSTQVMMHAVKKRTDISES